MLILTRRAEESVAIGDDVIVKVISIKGNQVVIGFEAPEEVVIRRTEIEWLPDEEYKKKQLNKKDKVDLANYIESDKSTAHDRHMAEKLGLIKG